MPPRARPVKPMPRSARKHRRETDGGCERGSGFMVLSADRDEVVMVEEYMNEIGAGTSDGVFFLSFQEFGLLSQEALALRLFLARRRPAEDQLVSRPDEIVRPLGQASGN